MIYTFLGVVAGILFVCIYGFLSYVFGPPIQHVRKIGDKTEKLAERMLADWDGCADEEDETSDNTPVRVRFTVHGRAVERSAGMSVAQLSNSRVVREAAASVRAKVGVVKRTAANELMVGRQVSQWLTEKKVRDTHRLAITPYAIELCFLPTKYEVEARDLAATKTWCDRREDYSPPVRLGQGHGEGGVAEELAESRLADWFHHPGDQEVYRPPCHVGGPRGSARGRHEDRSRSPVGPADRATSGSAEGVSTGVLRHPIVPESQFRGAQQ